MTYDKTLKLVSDNDFLSCDQHGFQDGCSCVTQLLECLFDWSSNIDEKLETHIIYLDFAKAFDTVPHTRLVHKLRQAGIRGKLLKWIETFLKGRRQRVVLRNGMSGWQNVSSGVPQGSILGPLLFLIYVNDIPGIITTICKLFADDTKVYNTIRNIVDCENLQTDLNTLSGWSETWLLNFNVEKCVALKLNEKENYAYTLNGTKLNTVTQQKDLGILISNNLHPRRHIQEIIKKANQRIGLIKRCFTGLDNKIEILYKTLVRPVLEYGANIWSPWQIGRAHV